MMARRVDVPEAIRRFVGRLRREVPGISPAEAIDAIRAVDACGLEDREAFRIALRATLVKRHEDLASFDREFARYFTAPTPKRDRKRTGRGAPGPGTGRGTPRPSIPASPEAARAAARAARIADLRRRVDPIRRRPGRLKILVSARPEAPGIDPAARPRRSGRPPRPPLPAGQGRRPARDRVAPDPRGGVAASSARRIPLTRDLPGEAEDRIAAEIPRLVSEIRLRAGRRHRARPRGRPWPARIMRRSLSTGGVPFVIPARRRRPRRADVILMVDVSWSVMRASALFLKIALEFLSARRRVAAFLFVDRCLDGRALLRTWDRASTRTFDRLLAPAEGIDPAAASDYGRAFWQAAAARRGPLAAPRRDAVLIVLGDGRSNRLDPQVWAFETIARRCRKVIWIVPEPEARWGTGDSALAEYLPWCDVVCEAHDLDGLARGIAECVRTL